MKREVNCESCAKEWRGGTSNGEGGAEYVKKVFGHAKRDWVCDGCGVEIDKGARCACVSVFTPMLPYRAWETTYIDRDFTSDDTRFV